MKTSELRKKSIKELYTDLLDLYREQFNLRLQKANDQLSRPSQIKTGRRNIARIKTIIKEKVK